MIEIILKVQVTQGIYSSASSSVLVVFLVLVGKFKIGLVVVAAEGLLIDCTCVKAMHTLITRTL
jgi:hypothetical protein